MLLVWRLALFSPIVNDDYSYMYYITIITYVYMYLVLFLSRCALAKNVPNVLINSVLGGYNLPCSPPCRLTGQGCPHPVVITFLGMLILLQGGLFVRGGWVGQQWFATLHAVLWAMITCDGHAPHP